METDKIAASLARAQPKFKPLIKNKTARIISAKANYEYKYADLADVFISIREALGQEEIAVVQTTSLNDKGGYLLSTRLLHSSGQSIESVMLLDRWPDPKLLGVEMSYLRRYALCALVGIASDDDTDADGLDHSKGKATKKDGGNHVPPPSERVGLDPEVMRAAVEDIEESETAEDLRARYSKAYKLALEAADTVAQSTLLAKYRGHALYVKPVPRSESVT